MPQLKRSGDIAANETVEVVMTGGFFARFLDWLRDEGLDVFPIPTSGDDGTDSADGDAVAEDAIPAFAITWKTDPPPPR